MPLLFQLACLPTLRFRNGIKRRLLCAKPVNKQPLTAQQLGLILSGLSLEFELSGRPDENTLRVSLYSDADTESFERELVRGEDYVYLSDRNAIRVEEDQLPPSQWYVQVKYTLLAVGATLGEEE